MGESEHHHAVIVGSGFSGIAMARALKRSGRDDFVILEQGNDVGGTWRDNTYPGIACDVPSNLYSYSFALNPDWSRSYSGGREINNYIRATAKKLGLLPHVRFNTRLIEAAWDESAQRWRIDTDNGSMTANFLVGGMGFLSQPMTPQLPGIEKFQGHSFHSQQWDHGYDLAGKRVAVVGTGASAIQFVPQIQPEVAELHLYQRTPPWIVPRTERQLSNFEHKLFRYLPFTQKLVRAGVYSFLEFRVLAFVKQPWLMSTFKAVALGNIRRHIKDKELRRKVTPSYGLGCKRVLTANNYYPALTKDNVEVITHGVTEVRENSIVADDGSEREVDAIIWGTGFRVTDNPTWELLRGRDGRTLTETWAETGARSYLGTLVPNFPNLLMMLGPNTNLGHSSMVYMIESATDYAISVLDHVERSGASSVEVREETVDAFERDIVSRSQDTVWMSGGCSSWYLDEAGRNTTIWPDYTFRYRRLCREFEPSQVKLGAADSAPAATATDTTLGDERHAATSA